MSLKIPREITLQFDCEHLKRQLEKEKMRTKDLENRLNRFAVLLLILFALCIGLAIFTVVLLFAASSKPNQPPAASTSAKPELATAYVYVGSIGNDEYHTLTCRQVNFIPDASKTFFTAESILHAGRVHCSMCAPPPIATPAPTATPAAVILNPSLLPENGSVLKGFSLDRIAPFTIETVGANYYYVKLRDPTTKKDIVSVFVYGKSEIEVEVPLGEFEMVYATGPVWYGTELLFDKDTAYFRADELFEFYEDSTGVYGWTVSLYRQQDGNLETIPLSPLDF